MGELKASPWVLRYALSLLSKKHDNSCISHACKGKKRPACLVIVDNATLLLGENIHEDLDTAFYELRTKRAPLLRMLYGDVQFLMGYVAAGTSFQWCFLHAGKVTSLIGCQHILAMVALRIGNALDGACAWME